MEKRRLSSDSGVTPDAKSARNGGSPGGMIDSIREANSVLLDDSIQELCGSVQVKESENVLSVNSVDNSAVSGDSEALARICENKGSEVNTNTNIQILNFLKRIDTRLDNVEKKLTKLDILEANINNIDSDVKKLWVYVQDNVKSCDEKINKCMDHIDNLQFALGQANDQLNTMAQDQSKLNDELDYLRSQSMRNNLIFGNIPEVMDEKPHVTESKDVVDKICIERAHRATYTPDGTMPVDFTCAPGEVRPPGPPRKPRNVYVKFASFKDRELVRTSSYNLKGTCLYVHEQFPKAVNDRRRALLPQLKAAKNNGHRAWISYDTLYVDGVAQSCNSVSTTDRQDETANSDEPVSSDPAPSVMDARGSGAGNNGAARRGGRGRGGRGGRSGGRGGGHGGLQGNRDAGR